MMAGPRLDEVDNHVFREGSRINSTWGGNLADMVRFDRILEIIEEDGLVNNAASVGAYLLTRLGDLQAKHASVSNARGRGLFCAADLPSVEFRDRVLKRCFQEGLVMLGCGMRSIRFRSPLVTTNGDVDQALDILSGCIRHEEQA